MLLLTHSFHHCVFASLTSDQLICKSQRSIINYFFSSYEIHEAREESFTNSIFRHSSTTSELDVLLLGCIFPRFCSVTAKSSLKHVPFLGWFSRSTLSPMSTVSPVVSPPCLLFHNSTPSLSHLPTFSPSPSF